MKRIKLPANENGSIMVVTLMILTLATMIGIAATITASTELQISGNDMRYAEIFYRAEAAAMMGARAIEDSTGLRNGNYNSDGQPIKLPKIIDRETGQAPELHDSDNIADPENWSDNTGVAAEAPDTFIGNGYETRFLPVQKPSLNLDVTEPTKMYEFTIYGRSVLESGNRKLGEVIIEVGYRKRY